MAPRGLSGQSLKGMYVFKFGGIVRPAAQPAQIQLINHLTEYASSIIATKADPLSEVINI